MATNYILPCSHEKDHEDTEVEKEHKLGRVGCLAAKASDQTLWASASSYVRLKYYMGWSLGLSPHLYKQRWVFINSTDMEDNIIKELTYSESYEESQTTHGFLVSLLTNWNSEGLWKHIQASRLIVLSSIILTSSVSWILAFSF